MSGNTFGKAFTVTTSGESHGHSYNCIVDGCPPGVVLDVADIQKQLDRRKPGKSRYVTQRREHDQVTITSGVLAGATLGTPIGMTIENTDAKSKDYDRIRDRFRPGHADYTYEIKYGRRDYRGGGRASARETCMRVAAGAVARICLKQMYGVVIEGYLAALGPHQLKPVDLSQVDQNPFFCADPDMVPVLEEFMQSVRKQGDSIGARVNVIARNVPPGLGEPVFDRLDADIAKALMSINAVRGVEIGDGFECVSQFGSEHRDEMSIQGFYSNHAGGVLGGISTGQDILASIAVKPTSSITIPGRTITATGAPAEIITTGRHDPCVGLRAVPIAEAMLALVLLDHAIRHRGQNAMVIPTVPQIPASRNDENKE
ncbi:MAG: chorismate synthase [Candidatus Porifericomitaceae bacterium WSBS_2022_MAG_OTU9]